MLIIPDKKVIFLHNPKTAGSSITQEIIKSDPNVLWFWGIQDNIDKAHITLQQLNNINPDYLSEAYFRFTVVRNPYDRVVSSYLDFVEKNGTTLVFDEYLEQIQLQKYLTDPRFIHGIPQHYYTHIDNELKVKFLKFENLDMEFLELLKSKLNFINNFKGLPKINLSGRKFDLNQKQIEKIAIVYSKDFELLNYKINKS